MLIPLPDGIFGPKLSFERLPKESFTDKYQVFGIRNNVNLPGNELNSQSFNRGS